ncbi:glycoside hydrolase family 3 protein [Pseudotabrizicola alkalilacus]|uniref:beta-N-acetylhexosaminidase n=1 Tax=Pseudotabrizicola alkalilacus TaxID=2305252 RepID=A0A411Z4M2_9RHOB|nr:glycoside hydrolase family 3 N-terminal domain-containing protein [Pseudotabrizicola alkalilacus]RGP38014.1 glycoside hydrolase family 3 protein [Pseudotabrizicola alkalilacus]
MSYALSDDQLRGAPFHLDAQALNWVKETFARLDEPAKLCQILIPMCRDLSEDATRQLAQRGFGGVHRFPSFSEDELRGSAQILTEGALVPPLLTADLELSEKASVKAGTLFPNQMTVAATSDPQNALRMGALAAREAGYLGFHLSWTPVADLPLNPRSNVVNTRSFSADCDKTITFMSAYIDGMHANGMAACVKHFPGDGLDDRDQHFVTTTNPMEMPAWHNSFGRIFRAAIARDVRVIMAGHIRLPAHDPSGLPASQSAPLLQGLLRDGLGYNGAIVSDATLMNGFRSQGPRSQIVPQCIEAGCDILLFPLNIDEDLAHLAAGLKSELLSPRRLDEAVLRILALKASLGLHRDAGLPGPERRAELLGTDEHRKWTQEVVQGAVTLLRDRLQLLPLDPRRHRRILLAEATGRRSPSSPLPDLEIAALLEAEGFVITRLQPGAAIDASAHDVGLYLMAEEGLSGKEHLGPQWERLHGAFPASMERLWHYLPTVYVSLGTPFLPCHMPDCPTFVNAYSPIKPMQQAVVAALCGRIGFAGISPADVTGGMG